MFVYIIINSVNGKYYVGKTTSPNLRDYFSRCMREALNGNDNKPLLYRAFRKYGPSAFRIEPLMSTLPSDEALLHWEASLIALFRCTDTSIGYNIDPGGRGVFMTAEVRRKISETKRKNPVKWTEERRQAHILKMTGRRYKWARPASPERLQRLSRRRDTETGRFVGGQDGSLN